MLLRDTPNVTVYRLICVMLLTEITFENAEMSLETGFCRHEAKLNSGRNLEYKQKYIRVEIIRVSILLL